MDAFQYMEMNGSAFWAEDPDPGGTNGGYVNYGKERKSDPAEPIMGPLPRQNFIYQWDESTEKYRTEHPDWGGKP